MVGAELAQGDAGVAQPLQGRLHALAVLVAARQQQDPIAAFVVEFQPGREAVQAFATVAGQALQPRLVGRLGLRRAGAPALPQPGQLADRQRQAQPDRGGGPGREQLGAQQAGVGKAGFLGGGAVALEHADLVAVGGQFIRRW